MIGWQQRQTVSFWTTTEGKYAPFKRELAETQTARGGFNWVLFSNLNLSLFC